MVGCTQKHGLYRSPGFGSRPGGYRTPLDYSVITKDENSNQVPETEDAAVIESLLVYMKCRYIILIFSMLNRFARELETCPATDTCTFGSWI